MKHSPAFGKGGGNWKFWGAKEGQKALLPILNIFVFIIKYNNAP